MKIYFIDINEILKDADKLGCKSGKFHHKYSREILSSIMAKFYGIINPKISEEKKKPYLEGSDLNFSISHSENLIAIAFNENDGGKIGFDIEYKRERKYNDILKYYGLEPNYDISQEEFYQIWTAYEAEYKSGIKMHLLNFNYENYMCALSFEIESDIKIYKGAFSMNNELNTEDYPLNIDMLPASKLKLK